MAVANAEQIDHAQPGPIDESVLTLQPNHQLEAIWNGQVKHNTKDLTNVHAFIDIRLVGVIGKLKCTSYSLIFYERRWVEVKLMIMDNNVKL